MSSLMGTIKRVASKLGLACALLLCAWVGAKAQETALVTASDEHTPAALAPGAPAGSYALSGFDNVNLFNGNLNFALPLVRIGGRGEAGYTIMLAIDSKGWNVLRRSNLVRNSQGQIIGETSIFFLPQSKQTWNPLDLGYSAGTMVGRRGGQGSLQVALNGACLSKTPLYQYTYTRLTFTSSAGEMDLYDQQTGGQPQAVPNTACNNPGTPGFDRGRVFISGDGSAATFIADSDITDLNFGNFTIHPSGYLFLANGLRYRIDSTGQVSSIQDRNGNQVTFQGQTTRDIGGAANSFTITDPLGRVTTVDYNVSDSTYGFGDRITYPGFKGASRVLFIVRTELRDALRGDQTLKNYTDLFDNNLNGAANITPQTFNPNMLATALYLPDGRRYRFLYNSYAELARVELPTGGAIEYDMTPGNGEISNSGPCSDDPEWQIYRRVAERRTLPDGATVEGRTTFSENAGVVTVDHLDHSHADALLTREIHYFNGNAAADLFSPRPAFTIWSEGKEFQTDIKDSNLNLVRSTTYQPQQGTTVPWFSQWLSQPVSPAIPLCFNQGGEPTNNPHNHETDTTLADVTPNQTSKQVFTYDQFNNVIQTDEYDFGASSPTRETVNTYLTRQSVGGVVVNYVKENVTSPTSTIHLRRLLTRTTVKGVVGGTLTAVAVTDHNYDEDGSAISDEPGIVGHDTSYGTAYQPRGNATSVTRYTNPGALSGPIIRKSTYDIAGNVVSKTDPMLGTTQITYDSFQGAFAFWASSTFPLPDRDHTGQASSMAPVSHQSHDYSSGLLTSFTDMNSQITSYDFTGDPLDRLVSVTRPDQGTTTYAYGDTVGDLNVHTLTSLDGSRNLEFYAYSDGLGRPIRSLQFDGTSGTPWVAKDTAYDAMGRIASVTNPHRVSSPSAVPDACSATVPCSTTAYDALSRVITQTTADGQSVTTGFMGNRTRVTDQAGLTKDIFHDALGRLTQVTENPTNVNGDGSPVTTYSYDALDDLVQVTQDGQQRFFLYDSLGRRTREFSPEEGVNASLNLADPLTGNSQWSTASTYDNNNNLLTITATGGIRTTYTYDALNRKLSETYSDTTTPPVTLFYDGKGITSGTNVTGRLTKVSSTVAFTTYDNYDTMGRVLVTTQNVDNQPYQMFYAYDRAGNLISEQYPSGRSVVTGTDAAGRPSSLTSSLDTKSYADQIQYSAHGGMTNLLLGNGFWEHVIYDSSPSDTSPLGRFQPTEIGVGTTRGASDILRLQYDYHNASGQNNGNVQRHWITAPTNTPPANFNVTQLALYDGLDRLNKMQELPGSNVPFPFQATAIWEQDFALDRWGNRTALTNTGVVPASNHAPAVDQSTNRFVVTGTGFGYDAAGNLATEPVDAGQNSYTYDANNHLVQSQTTSIGTANYSYDGLGHRIKKTVNGQTTVFAYDVLGRLVAEYNPAVTPTNGTRYLTQDILGSTRLLTGSDPNSGAAVVVARYDYLPYGEIIPSGLGGRGSVGGYGPEGPLNQLFTGKEKDSETNLDYFLARYDSGEKGRFTSPDPPFAGWRLNDPQSLNLYAYVGNNPLIHVDPSGRAPEGEEVLDPNMLRLLSPGEGLERRTVDLPPEKGEGEGGEYTSWLYEMAIGQQQVPPYYKPPPPHPGTDRTVNPTEPGEAHVHEEPDDDDEPWNPFGVWDGTIARRLAERGYIADTKTGKVLKDGEKQYRFRLFNYQPSSGNGAKGPLPCTPGYGCWEAVPGTNPDLKREKGLAFPEFPRKKYLYVPWERGASGFIDKETHRRVNPNQ